MSVGSLLAPLLIGVALGDLLNGVPIDAQQEFTGSCSTSSPRTACSWA